MRYTPSEIILSLFLFLAAGLCEISGGWLVWKWRKEGGLWIYFILGCFILIAYGIIPTFQKQDFGRTYAAYGGFFIVLSLIWGWAVDRDTPDLWDGVGAVVALVGVCVIMFAPR